jgi:hypothetical protein
MRTTKLAAMAHTNRSGRLAGIDRKADDAAADGRRGSGRSARRNAGAP